MSSLNGTGNVGHGVGGGNASVDNVAFSPGGWAGWIDDDHGFFANGADNWVCGIYELSTKTIRRAVTNPADPQFGAGMNAGYAGGGVWAAWLAAGTPQSGLFTSYGLHLPNAGLMAVGPTGELGYKPDYQSFGPTVCRETNGTEWQITPSYTYDLQLLGNRQAMWRESTLIRVINLPQPQQVGNVWGPRAHNINGRWWVSYYSDRVGIVVHPFDSTDGIVVVPIGVDTWHSCRSYGTVIKFALFNSEAEQNGQLRTVSYDLATYPLSPLVPTAPPATIPTFTFTHPVIVAPFKDPQGETVAPWEVVVNQAGQNKGRPCLVAEDSLMGPIVGPIQGIYSEAIDPSHDLQVAASYQTRLVLVHDATTDWTPPAGLRPYDVPGIELYLSQSETLDQSVGRWHTQVAALLTAWKGPIAVVPQFYCMGGAPPNELFTVNQACDGLAHLSDLVNMNARVTLILPFAYLRANGITGHSELRQAFTQLMAAQQKAGLGSLLPVVPDPTPPDPPKPTTPYAHHRLYSMKGQSMETKTVAVKGPGGLYARADKRNTGPWADLGRGWRGVIFDGENASEPDYQFELTKPDNKFQIRHTSTSTLLGLDATKYSGDIGAQFYLKPEDEGRGAYEMPVVYDGNLVGALTGQVEYDDPELGKFVSCAFVVEVLE